MHYRPEIDGLRAIAVTTVVLFHAGVAPFGGGFVGVDVFFVISGYLIAGLIARDIAQGRFSLADFYERRARRLLPALFLVLAATLPLAWLTLPPGAWQDHLLAVTSTVLFASNLLFWSQAGYFDTAAAEKPLLHTWSLAVEEQFYLLFPLLLLALWRLGPRRVALTLGGLALLSLAACAGPWDSETRYYLAPFRAWEFLAGALCALVPVRRPLPLAGPGLALILASGVLYTAGTPFPSVYTLVPVLGAVFVVLAPARDPALRLLSSRPLVGLGLISYPVYLWHQPLLVFGRLSDLPAWAMPALVAAALGLGWATWRFIETPFRRPVDRRLPGRRALFSAATGAGLSLAAVALAAAVLVPSWLELRHPGLARAGLSAGIDRPVCPGFTEIGDTVRCRVHGDGPLVLAVWGDSHAKALEQALTVPPGTSVYVLSNKGCPPILGVRRADTGKNTQTCQDPALTEAHVRYLESLAPGRIVLVGRWTTYLNGWIKDGVLQPSTHFLTDGSPGEASADTSRRVFVRQLDQTVARLSRTAPVWLVAQPPDLALMPTRDRAAGLPLPRVSRDAWHQAEAEALSRLTAPVRLVSPTDLFCDDVECAGLQGERRLYLDDNHLSPEGAARLWPRIVQSLALPERVASLQPCDDCRP